MKRGKGKRTPEMRENGRQRALAYSRDIVARCAAEEARRAAAAAAQAAAKAAAQEAAAQDLALRMRVERRCAWTFFASVFLSGVGCAAFVHFLLVNG